MIAVDRYKIVATPFKTITEGKKTRLVLIIVTFVLSSIISWVSFIIFNNVDSYAMMPTDISFIHL